MRYIKCCGYFTLAVIAACQAGDPPLLSSSTSAVAGTDRLNTGEVLHAGEAISAGSTSLLYQGDNNLVLYQNGTARWATMAALGSTPNVFAMQGDCNAVVYNTGGPVWASGTSGRGSSCYARVIDGDWFICSGSNRVFSARGGGDCGGGTGGYQCSEPSGAIPLPFVNQFHVRADPDSLYVCDTSVGFEGHFPWPQVSTSDLNECVGACGAGCSDNTCTHYAYGPYNDVGGGKMCRNVHYDCYSTDCCWYHDLCGRMYPTALFTDPFCSSLAVVYGCELCAGPGFNGCSGPGYTRSFDVSYTEKRDCCTDRPGDCRNDCTGQCWPGCDVNNDCYDDCTGQYVCIDPFCPDYCNGLCGGYAWCYIGDGLSGGESPSVAAPDLRVRVGGKSLVWTSAELAAAAAPLAQAAALTPEQEDGLGSRSGWSLRDLVHRKLGSAARAVALIGDDGSRVELDADAWASTDSTPILRVNRKGQLRFHWVGVRNRLPGLRGVQQIEVSTDPAPRKIRDGSETP